MEKKFPRRVAAWRERLHSRDGIRKPNLSGEHLIVGGVRCTIADARCDYL